MILQHIFGMLPTGNTVEIMSKHRGRLVAISSQKVFSETGLPKVLPVRKTRVSFLLAYAAGNSLFSVIFLAVES